MTNLKNYLIGDRTFYRRVISILIPIIIQNTVTNVVSLLDNVMVGTVGTLQMSAVAIVNQLLFVFYIAVFGGLSGAGIFAAQYAGAGDHKGVAHCFRMKAYIALGLVGAALVVFLTVPQSLISMYLAEGTSAEEASATLSFAEGYLGVMLVGILPFGISQIYGSTLRELGETKVPMIASVSAIFVNLIFNYLLIFGNKGLPLLPFEPLGVIGAAIATVLSRFVEMAIIVAFVHKNAHRYPFIKEAFKSFKIPLILCGDIAKKGSPLLINEFFWSLGMALLSQCYSVRGLEAVAASNICTTAANLFNVVFLSMGNAIAIVAGQHLGAGEFEKAKISVWRLLALSSAACVVMGGIVALCAPFIPLLYNTTDTVRGLATGMLFVSAAMMPIISFVHGCYFALRSGGRTLITLLFDCGFTWGVCLPLAFVLSRFTAMPLVMLYLCVQLVEVVKSGVGFILVKKGVWLNNIAR
ncbi:MAG: MATE family efflux transporter [Clostridia bacterium]|nr:MATE family efflux transporter [Clostridia bacterium]